MLKSKLFQMILAMLIVLTLVLTAALFMWNYMDKKNAAPPAAANTASAANTKKASATEVKEMTYQMKDIITNLSGKDRIVQIGLAFELSTKKARTEFEQLDFKVRGIVNQTLADMTAEQMAGSKGQANLTSTLISKINPILTEGEVQQIWITNLVFQ
ncbi:hypothetical protein J31TS4_00990 [Paenibacillus sp. J31TS4]|uniref:flagellar basal body-associated FliL family protein n=1 Tax=Paenibacillus sp. J31TS4 TaxID=2807195 RepID=UPI001B2D6350|nr:flagellar basal body-associated FliL family protein [Paenibacillus sp. J31TS4]GIP36819.1 hypothetical protein J31TS4_00990 [Paenibacillus sp. J31TS4]